MLNTNARAIFFLSHTLFFYCSLSSSYYFFSSSRRRPPFFFLLLLLLLFFYYSIWRTHKSETEDVDVDDGREGERTRVKDDCMSNLRHGDYNYVTLALVLLLHFFFAQPSSNPIRRTRLFLLLCVCARMYVCTHLRIYIYINVDVCEREREDRTLTHLP